MGWEDSVFTWDLWDQRRTVRQTSGAFYISDLYSTLLNYGQLHMCMSDSVPLKIRIVWPWNRNKAPSFLPFVLLGSRDAHKDTESLSASVMSIWIPSIFTVLLLIVFKQQHSCRLVPGNWLHIGTVTARVRFTLGPEEHGEGNTRRINLHSPPFCKHFSPRKKNPSFCRLILLVSFVIRAAQHMRLAPTLGLSLVMDLFRETLDSRQWPLYLNSFWRRSSKKVRMSAV